MIRFKFINYFLLILRKNNIMLQENIDFIVIKRAGMFDGSRLKQLAGNLIVTKNCVIYNVVENIDVMGKVTNAMGSKHEDDYRLDASGEARNITDAVHNVKVATKDLKASWSDAKDDFAKLKIFGKAADIVRQIAKECDSVSEFEKLVIEMYSENPKSFVIPLGDVKKVKAGFFSGLQLHLQDGTVKKFGPHGRSKVKKMIGI